MALLRRSLQILWVFVGYLLALATVRLQARLGQWLGRPISEHLEPRHLRLALERLGGTFIKFGQILAMRPDLLRPSYVEELSRLLDETPPFDGEIARALVEQELGGPVSQLFQEFDERPVAAASFAQVHRARLPSGECVAVKVQRPGLRRSVEIDLRFVRFLSALVDLSGVLFRIKTRRLVADFEQWTCEELDLTTEATYAERLRRNHGEDPRVCIPRVYWDHTTSRVLTLEFMEGIWVAEILRALDRQDQETLARWREAGLDLPLVAENLFQNSLTQVFDHELFHADPHAGNLVVLSGNRIGYVDFGIVGHMGREMRGHELSMLTMLGAGEVDGFFRAFLRIGNPPPEDVDLPTFANEVKRNVLQWQNAAHNPRATLQERSAATMIMGNLNAARDHGLSFEEVTTRYYRVLTVSELMILRLDPAFDFRAQIQLFSTRLQLRELRAAMEPPQLLTWWLQTQLALTSLPRQWMEAGQTFQDDRRTLFAAVNGTRTAFSNLLHGLSRALLLAAVAVPVFRFALPERYAQELPVDWRWLALSLLLLVPVFAWTARRLRITSVRNDILVRRGR